MACLRSLPNYLVTRSRLSRPLRVPAVYPRSLDRSDRSNLMLWQVSSDFSRWVLRDILARPRRLSPRVSAVSSLG
jgi:hypothetical protein